MRREGGWEGWTDAHVRSAPTRLHDWARYSPLLHFPIPQKISTYDSILSLRTLRIWSNLRDLQESE